MRVADEARRIENSLFENGENPNLIVYGHESASSPEFIATPMAISRPTAP